MQRIDKKPHIINYVTHTLNVAQVNYPMIENEFLAIVFTFEKFRPCLIGSHVIVSIEHIALKYLIEKKDVMPRLTRWTMLL